MSLFPENEAGFKDRNKLANANFVNKNMGPTGVAQ